MFAKRSFVVLSASERLALQQSWLRSGRCIRCFRASIQRNASGDESKSNDEGTPYNAPKRGPTRQQRAAMVSEEVQMLQRDHPSPGFAESDPNTLRPPGASKTVDPENVGIDVGPGTMGEQDAASREGPYAQGAARVVSDDNVVMDNSKEARGVRSPHDKVEDPAKGAPSIMDTTGEARSQESVARTVEEEEDRELDVEEEDGKYGLDGYETRQQSQDTGKKTQSPAFEPEHIYRDELLRQHNTSTISGNNFENVIEDRIKSITGAGSVEKTRHPRSLAYKMLSGHLIHFVSNAEKAAVEEEARKIAQKRAEALAKQKGAGEDEVKPTAKLYRFQPLPEKVQKTIVDKVVAGRYDVKKMLSGESYYKQSVLNSIARTTMLNGTYLARDRNRVLEKVRSLLPVAQSVQQPQRAGQKASEAKKA